MTSSAFILVPTRPKKSDLSPLSVHVLTRNGVNSIPELELMVNSGIDYLKEMELINFQQNKLNPQINLPFNFLIQKYFFHDNPTWNINLEYLLMVKSGRLKSQYKMELIHLELINLIWPNGIEWNWKNGIDPISGTEHVLFIDWKKETEWYMLDQPLLVEILCVHTLENLATSL